MTHRRVRLSTAAEADIADILDYTLESFGEAQTDLYGSLLAESLDALRNGPGIVGSRSREDILPGLYSLHIGRLGQKARHLIFFRKDDGEIIEVLRVLHDAMELTRHLPGAN